MTITTLKLMWMLRHDAGGGRSGFKQKCLPYKNYQNSPVHVVLLSLHVP